MLIAVAPSRTASAPAVLPPPKFDNAMEEKAHRLKEEGKKLEEKLFESRPAIWKAQDVVPPPEAGPPQPTPCPARQRLESERAAP